MDPELLKHLGQIAGIGGIAVGAFLLITKELIRKAVFPKLTKRQSSWIILSVAVMAWTTALAGIGAWTYVEIAKRGTDTGDTLTIVHARRTEEISAYLSSRSVPVPGKEYSVDQIVRDFAFNKSPFPQNFGFPILNGSYTGYTSQTGTADGSFDRIVVVEDERVLAVMFEGTCHGDSLFCDSNYADWTRLIERCFGTLSWETKPILLPQGKGNPMLPATNESASVYSSPWRAYLSKSESIKDGKNLRIVTLLVVNDPQ